MNKKIKYFIFFLIFLLSANCSLDNKTGIWTEDSKNRKRISKQEEQRSKSEIINVYSSKGSFLKEIPPTKRINLTKPKKNSSWKMSGLNLQNFFGNIYLSGINNNFLREKIGKDKFSISQNTTSPLIFNDNIFFSDDTGTIFKINQKGKVIWKKNIYKKINKTIYKNLSLSIYKDKIFIADNFGFIYAMSIENGKLIWIKNHGIPLKSNIKIFDDKIFVINQDNRIICFDIKLGSKIWDVRSLSSFIKSQSLLSLAISKEGDLIALNSSGELLKIRARSGTIIWSLNAIGSTFAHATDFFKSSDVVINGNDIIFSSMSSIFSFDLSNGYLNWVKEIGTENTPIINNKNIFLVSDDGFFINIDRNTGKIIWSTNILKILKQKKQKTQITGFIMGSGKIYAVSLNGYLIVCSATSGKVEYFKKISDKITTAPIISNGSLYILTSSSRLLGFR
jgi:outer membrane protein assembly factor BamB